MRPNRRIPGLFGVRGAWVGAILLLAGLIPPEATAQPRPTRPDLPGHYAITGATIVTVSGQTIENGTVVIRDGIIQAVGRNVDVPAGAWVIDGTGKTVYPGLVDAMTTLGHPSSAPPRPQGFGFGNQGPIDEENHSWGPEDRPGTHSWVTAADDLDRNDDRIAAWRNGGFTSAVSTLAPGLVTGQAAFINLGEPERAREMVVKTPVGMRLNIQDRSYTGYPNSIMGSFAYLKQLYFDAYYYRAVWGDYDANPRGKARPEWDQALEPIRAQLNEGWPVLFPGQDRKEIARAIKTSSEMRVTPVVYGAQGGYAAADLLAEAGVAALVDVDWPEPPRNGDPESEPSLETLRFWDRAATTPMMLAEAGVPFAFYSGGASDPAAVLDGVRKAVAMGLSSEDAIRALTLSPAEIFGVSDRLGSIESGKLANLIVASGDLFQDGTRVEDVFVDGVRFDVPAPSAMAARNGARARRGGDEAESDEEEEVQAPIPMAQDKGPYRADAVTFIRNATILTASQGTIENGDILIRDGKIAELGTDLSAPSNARVVDGTGKYVIPGIIDAHSHMAADAINEGAVNVSSMVGIKDVLDPNDVGMYWALAGGVTSINILHGSANPIGGKNAVIKLRWGADADELIIDGAIEGIKFALGENTKRDRNPDRYPSTRMGVQDVVRQAFLDATEYMEEWDAYEAGGRRGIEPRRDLEMEALAEILRGDRVIHSHSYRADEILQLIRLAEEFDITLGTFQHVLEGYKVADEIAAHGAGASTFSDWWAYKVEAYDAIPYNAALMTERGVLVSINSDSGEEIRHLNQEAAKAMKWGGMDEQSALRLVTLNPAIQLQISDHTGSIDVGKDADLAIYDDYPLSMFAKVVQTYVDGQLYFDIDMDQERQAAIAAEKEALLERYGPSSRGSGTVTDVVAPTEGKEEIR
jgi:imidazolonepropionase-like amidohydrolase